MMSTDAFCATGSAASQELGLSPHSGNLLDPGDPRGRHRASLHLFSPVSVSQQPRGPAADGLLCAGTRCARARAWRWRDPCTARTSLCPATAVCPCQNKPSTLPYSDPWPSRAACNLPSAFLHLPAPSLPCSCLQRSWLQAERWVSSRNCPKGQQGVLKRAQDGGAVSNGNTAGVQTAGFIFSFSTCSPTLSWHKGTQHSESQRHRTSPAQSDLPLQQRGWGYPWGYPREMNLPCPK